jgi:selenide, water dikinase
LDSRDLTRTLILIGGGHGHVSVIRHLLMRPNPTLRLIVIAPESHAPYSGMLPGFLSRAYTEDALFLDVAGLTEQAGGWFIRGELVSLDAERQRVQVRRPVALGGELLPEIHYDWASINTGAAPRNAFPSTHAHLFYVKPLKHLLDQLPQIDAALEGSGRSLIVVGGGAAGVELALAFRVRHPKITIHLIAKRPFEADPALAAGAHRIRHAMQMRAITLIEGLVVAALPGTVTLEDGRELAADCVLVSTPVAPPEWLVNSDLPKAANGFLTVDAFLAVNGYSNLFACGDIAELHSPRARAGVMAVRAGQYLAQVLDQIIRGQPRHAFRPQKHWLTLINCGDGEAIFIKGWLALQGRWVWWLKDRIDQSFMRQFAIQPMEQDVFMRCEGCAAKLPGEVLRDEFGANFEDASVDPSQPQGALRSIDGLSYLVADPHLMGRLAMRHAASDIWAMGGTPRRSLALIAAARTGQPDLESAEFSLVIAGLRSAAKAYGVCLDGGHSVALTQPMVAVSIDGDAMNPIRKQGAVAGNVLVISGPIGSGVLFAGFRQGRVPGRYIDRYLQTALESLQDAAAIASQVGVSAMTDVTGFGLAGHLAEMLEGTLLGVDWAPNIPVYDGVEAAIAVGVKSTAADGNASYAGHIGANAPSAVVFDPQTAGPLLVAVETDRVDTLLGAWRDAGYQPAVVGRVTTETS